MANKRDREKLRVRVRAAVERSGSTQKDIESAAGWAPGTLSRVFSGKKHPDAELIRVLADRLATTPAELVAGTGFAELFSVVDTEEGAVERVAAPPVGDLDEPSETTQEANPDPLEKTVASAPPLVAEPPIRGEPSPSPSPSPAPATPAPAPAPRAPEAVDRGPRPEWKPPPEPRQRKRDVPKRLLKRVLGWFGV